MKELSAEAARTEALRNPKVMNFFTEGYKSTLNVSNPKTMNDRFVRPNAYYVNDEFENDPQWFIAHFLDNAYRVLRVIYVREDLRNKGIGSQALKTIQENTKEKFIQIGVENTADETLEKLDAFYKRLKFQRTPLPLPHRNNCSFFDYFWSSEPFKVIQQGKKIGVTLT